MSPVSRVPGGNKLLQALSRTDFALLRPHLRPGLLPLEMELEQPNRRIDRIYFMNSGIASVVALHPYGVRVEIGIIGGEGMSGIPVVLGNDRSPHATYMQAAGDGQSIASGKLRTAMGNSRSLHASLLKYVQAFAVQTAHTAIANARGKIHERLARWLLMAHDRMKSDELTLTHEFLSLMLGVRRSGVTEALNVFRNRRLVTTGRNKIVILDRKRIEKIAGSYYGTPEKEYRRLFR